MVCKARLEDAGRSPCGERGLKCLRLDVQPTATIPSLPVRGAWIEIDYNGHVALIRCVAPRAGSVD